MIPEPVTLHPTLDRHRQRMQDSALRVESMLRTVIACLDDPARRNICTALLEDAQLVAKDLNTGLDTTRFQLEGAD